MVNSSIPCRFCGEDELLLIALDFRQALCGHSWKREKETVSPIDGIDFGCSVFDRRRRAQGRCGRGTAEKRERTRKGFVDGGRPIDHDEKKR